MVVIPLKEFPVTTTKQIQPGVSPSEVAQPYRELANTMEKFGEAGDTIASSMAEQAGAQSVTRDANGEIQVQKSLFVGPAAAHWERARKMAALAEADGAAQREDIKLRADFHNDPQGYLKAADEFAKKTQADLTAKAGPEIGVSVRRVIERTTTQTYRGLQNEFERLDLQRSSATMAAGVKSATDDLSAMARGGKTSGPDWDAAWDKYNTLQKQRTDNPRLSYPQAQADYEREHLVGTLGANGFLYHVDQEYKAAPTKAEGAQRAIEYAKDILTNPKLKLTQAEREAYYHKAVGEIRANEAIRKQDIGEAKLASQQLIMASSMGLRIDPDQVEAVAKLHMDAGDQAGAARFYAHFARAPLNDDQGRRPIPDQARDLMAVRGQAAAKSAYDFFVGRGYTPAQASGIVGNLIHESGLDPNAIGDAGTSVGLAQFHNERATALAQFAKDTKRDPRDFQTQLEFIDKELRSTEGRTFQALQGATTPEAAAAAFVHYERPKGYDPNNLAAAHGFESRVAQAKAVFGGQGNLDTGSPASALWLQANRARTLDTAARTQWKQVWADYEKEGIRPPDRVVNDLIGAARAVGDHDLLETIAAAGDRLALIQQQAGQPLPAQAAQIAEFHRQGAEGLLQVGQQAVLKDLERKYAKIQEGLKDNPIATTVANFGTQFKTPAPLNTQDPGQLAAGLAYRGRIAQFAAQNWQTHSLSALDKAEAGAISQADPQQAARILAATNVLEPETFRATMASEPMKGALDGMIRSYDPIKLNAAMGVLDKYWRQDPIGFKETFKDDAFKRLQTWQSWKDSASPAEMAERFKRADDPAMHGAREKLGEQADKEMKGWTPQTVAGAMGSSSFITPGFIARNITGSEPFAPSDSVQAGQLQYEFEQGYKDMRKNGVDADQALKRTGERMNTIWGTSAAGGGTLMRYPPERYYPQVNGSHDWLQADVERLIDETKGQVSPEIPAEATVPSDVPTGGTMARRYSLKNMVSDARTEADIQNKRPPSYQIIVTDRATGQDEILTDAAGNHRFAFDPRALVAASEAKFTAEHAVDAATRAHNLKILEGLRASARGEAIGEIKGPLDYFFGSEDGGTNRPFEQGGPQMSMLGDFFGRITGSDAGPKTIEGDRSSGYPTAEDAAFARKYDFAYGKEWEPFFNNLTAKIIGERRPSAKGQGEFRPQSMEGGSLTEALTAPAEAIDLTNPKHAEIHAQVKDLFARAALAVNRDPIASLGFAPSKTMIDVAMKKANIAGAYGPEEDTIYSNLTSQSNIVHESIHRGVEQLRKRSPEAAQLLKDAPFSEESLVRYIMATTMGNPEQGGGSIADKQREQAMFIFGQSLRGNPQKTLTRLREIAAEEIAKKRPGGPR